MSCPYCGSAASEIITTKLPLLVPGLEQLAISVVRCNGCDLYYSTPLPDRFDVLQETFFMESWETNHRNNVMNDWISMTWRPEPTWRKAARWIKQAIGAPPALSVSRAGEAMQVLLDKKPKTLLDVGTSYGGFVRSARLAGIQAYGIDPNHELVRRLHAYGVDCISQGVFEANPGPLGVYDALTFLSVVDHFPYITPAFFKSCAELLNPGGRTIICDVDPELQFVRDTGVLRSPISFSYLTVKFMKRAAAEAGLQHSYRRCESEPMYIFHVLTK